MSPGRRGGALLLILPALALGALGCGDDEPSDPSVPSISVPQGAPQSVPETTTAPAPASTEPSGGTKTPSPQQEDSATNDIPPPPGSPQEAFEQACKKNPAACG
ncbi:MAG: hypothetical protein M3M99_04460 [Actinomycetota bacterium]|nr:hypothetical protein [Actinomycetota bacterium]